MDNYIRKDTHNPKLKFWGVTSEVPGLGFFFAAMWSLRNEPWVGAKTIDVRYPSGRRGITTARFDEGEASRKQWQPQCLEKKVATTVTARKLRRR